MTNIYQALKIQGATEKQLSEIKEIVDLILIQSQKKPWNSRKHQQKV